MTLTAAQYESLYHFLFAEADHALTELQNGAVEAAQMRLQTALLRCEELYLDFTE